MMETRKKGIVAVLILLLCIAIGIYAVSLYTRTLPRATHLTPSAIQIDPGQIITGPNGPEVHLSAQAVDANGTPVDDVRYQWGMSSTNSIGTIHQEIGNDKLATFTPSGNIGQGDIWARAIDDKGKKVIGSIGVFVGVQPPPPPAPINWETPSVSLVTSQLKITAGDKTFYGIPDPNTTMSIHSDPPTDGDPNYTTLELMWTEQGVQMRFFMYLHRDSDKWWASEIRTYNGNATYPDWIYYTDEKYFKSKLGETYHKSGSMTIKSTSNNPKGKITFSGLDLIAFTAPINGTPTPTPPPVTLYITPTPTPAPTPTPSPIPPNSTIEFRIKFTGVDGGSADGAGVTARFVNTNINLVTPPIIFSHIGDSVYKAVVALTGSFALPPGPGYSIVLKGEKHVIRKFCAPSGQTTPCQGNGTITLPSVATPLLFDFTGLSLDPGDLPPQDGRADVNDFNVIKSKQSIPSSSLTQEDLNTADLDYNGYIDSSDAYLMRHTLETRYDEY